MGQAAGRAEAPVPRVRCTWVPEGDLLYRIYHDEEWGVPVFDDRALFEFLVLEGAQAGLSWRTILGRRDAYREVFQNFVPEEVASMGPRDVERLLGNVRIIRNRAKIESAVGNARALLRLRSDEGVTFSAFLWDFVGGTPVIGRYATSGAVPTETDLSRALSRRLRGAGFRFVGPVILQSYLEATGFLMDHAESCFRFPELAGATMHVGPAS